MIWKNRYGEIRKGDKLKMIKLYSECGNSGCCNINGYKIGAIFKVNDIIVINRAGEKRFRIKTANGGQCQFPKECFVKVLE